jgi:hypothetical protein
VKCVGPQSGWAWSEVQKRNKKTKMEGGCRGLYNKSKAVARGGFFWLVEWDGSLNWLSLLLTEDMAFEVCEQKTLSGVFALN